MADGIAFGVDKPEGDEPADQIRMETRSAGDGLQGKSWDGNERIAGSRRSRSGMGDRLIRAVAGTGPGGARRSRGSVGHRVLLGSNEEVAASSSNSSRSPLTQGGRHHDAEFGVQVAARTTPGFGVPFAAQPQPTAAGRAGEQ
ncbi:hypothetical protein SMICM304S_06339 [Streptomyces microflavus]